MSVLTQVNSVCFRRILIFALAALFLSHAARADDAPRTPNSEGGRLNILEENDLFSFSNQDRHYTQGMLATYLSRPVAAGDYWDAPFNALGDNTPIFSGADRKRKWDWDVVGQSIFTPANLSSTSPSSKDRPYGAWLYTGAGMLQESKQQSHNTLENVELLVGIVGPEALGAVTQDDFHQFIGVKPARGWQNQLKTEPGVVLTYERKWRFQQPLGNNFAVDAIPEAGLTGGNIFTYAETGGMVRFGQKIFGADYGPARIRPSLSGTNWFDPDQLHGKMGWYIFGGIQGRAVARNIFLDGNTISDSPSVNKEPLVADFTGGVSLLWSTAVRVDATYTQRTPEFYGQGGQPDKFGGINLVVGF